MTSRDVARAVCQLYRRETTFGPYTLHDDEDRVSCLALHNYATAKSGKPVELLRDRLVHVYLAKCNFRHLHDGNDGHDGHTLYLCDCVDMRESVRLLRGLALRSTTRAGPLEPISPCRGVAYVFIAREKESPVCVCACSRVCRDRAVHDQVRAFVGRGVSLDHVS